MSKSHFLIYCDRPLVDCAIKLILESDSNIKVASSKVVAPARIEETTDVYLLERGPDKAWVAIIIGDRNSQVGPFNGEYWINIDGEPQWFFRNNKVFAKTIKDTLIARGARENRRR